jgi:small-conductance mechanosensitive channel
MEILEILYLIAVFLIIICMTWLISRLMGALVGRLFRRSTPIVAAHAKRLISILIWVIGLLFALEQIGMKVDLLLLFMALGGIALIVATKDALQNIASKYFSDVYIPYKVGDAIKIGNYSGKVIEINPMSTILMSDTEEVFSVPNSLFLREVVVNITPQAWKEVIIPISIDSAIDLPHFENDLLKRVNKLRIHFDERIPPILTVRNRDQRVTELQLTLMIKDPSKKDMVTAEVNSKIQEAIESTRMRIMKR